MKKSFYAGEDALHRSQRQEQRATEAFDKSQRVKQHEGRRATPTSAPPAKAQSRQATGGYVGGNPFKGLK
jgi:hypothetical protein